MISTAFSGAVAAPRRGPNPRMASVVITTEGSTHFPHPSTSGAPHGAQKVATGEGCQSTVRSCEVAANGAVWAQGIP